MIVYLEGVGAETSINKSSSPTPAALRRIVFCTSFPLNSNCCWTSGTCVCTTVSPSVQFPVLTDHGSQSVFLSNKSERQSEKGRVRERDSPPPLEWPSDSPPSIQTPESIERVRHFRVDWSAPHSVFLSFLMQWQIWSTNLKLLSCMTSLCHKVVTDREMK